MFRFDSHLCTLSNINVRTEKHGDEHVNAVDLKFTTDVHSSVLDQFDTSLRPFLFRKPSVGEQQNAIDDLTGVRLPTLKPLVLDEEFTGYTVRLPSPMNLRETVELIADLKKFSFDPVEGGSVAMAVTASCHPTAEQMSQLYDLLSEDVQVSLIPPSVEEEREAA